MNRLQKVADRELINLRRGGDRSHVQSHTKMRRAKNQLFAERAIGISLPESGVGAPVSSKI
ncbi:MAG: hypothetical protein HC879_13225 [Leptolyngbyaceae cyanobacterium SL_5_9]|nr:hypothetical protein [Leptolyngbyaceae cyanobacterium SL_5_9]